MHFVVAVVTDCRRATGTARRTADGPSRIRPGRAAVILPFSNAT